MDLFTQIIAPEFLVLAFIIGAASGFVKGVVGFGMPMIFISGLSSFLSPELALAGLILPTVASNVAGGGTADGRTHQVGDSTARDGAVLRVACGACGVWDLAWV